MVPPGPSSHIFALVDMSCDSHHKFKAGTWKKNMLPKGLGKKITFMESLNVSKKKVVTIDPSFMSPRRRKPKYTTSYVDCPEFSTYLERTCSESMPRRRLVAMYLAVWLSEVIIPIAGKMVCTGCIYPTCRMAFGVRYDLALALINYLCTRLKMIGILVRCAKSYSRYYGDHLLYACSCTIVAACSIWEIREISHFTEPSQMGATWVFLLRP